MSWDKVVTVTLKRATFSGRTGLLEVGSRTNIEMYLFDPNVYAFTNPDEKKEWEELVAEQKEAKRLEALKKNSEHKEVEVLRAENSMLESRLKELEALVKAKKPAPEEKKPVAKGQRKPL